MGLQAHKTGLKNIFTEKIVLLMHCNAMQCIRFDNSGRAGEANWVKEDQVERTKEVLRMISVTVRGWVEEGLREWG